MYGTTRKTQYFRLVRKDRVMFFFKYSKSEICQSLATAQAQTWANKSRKQFFIFEDSPVRKRNFVMLHVLIGPILHYIH